MDKSMNSDGERQALSNQRDAVGDDVGQYHGGDKEGATRTRQKVKTAPARLIPNKKKRRPCAPMKSDERRRGPGNARTTNRPRKPA